MPQISLCMITRNEEASIARCLNSVSGLADEIIAVDTGSTDKTCDILRAHGAQVYPFEWVDDFSAARNYGLERARGDWALWLDADEWLAEGGADALRALLSDTRAQALSLPMCHYYGPEPLSGARAHLSRAVRLFRREAGLRFVGRIHERLEPGDGAAPLEAEEADAAEILHDGYAQRAAEKKSGRNLALLMWAWAAGEEDPWIVYHIAAELHRMRRFDESYRLVNAAIAGFLEEGRMPPAHLYKLKYETLLVTGNAASALPAIERAAALYPDYADLHFYKGLSLISLGRHREAKEAFQYCLVLGDGNPKYLSMRGVGSFFALYHLGVCHEALGEREAARIAYRQALSLDPESGTFRDSCARLS